MAKKIFKMDESGDTQAHETVPAEEINIAEAAATGDPAVSDAELASVQTAVPEKPKKKPEKNQKGKTAVLQAQESVSADSAARAVSDKYSADLLVKNLLNKTAVPTAAESGAVNSLFSESNVAEKISEPETPVSEPIIDNSRKTEPLAAEDNADTVEGKAAEEISALALPEPEAEKSSGNISAEKVDSGKEKKSRAKEVSEKLSADLIVDSLLKGGVPPATTPKNSADSGENTKTKKVFKSVPDGDSAPADLGAVDQPPISDTQEPAKKHITEKPAKETMPAFTAQKKQPKTFARVLKSIYRVAVTTFKALLLTVPFLAVIAYTNMYVDPGRLYHIDRDDMFEYDIVRMMREGHNVENLNNYNERLVKREYINQMEEPVDVIIAGSSRGALITKDMLNVESMFNTSVSGGSLDDVIGFYGVLHQYDLLPEAFIIVLDPWMLNDNHYDNRYERSIGDGYYNYMTSRMGYTVDESLKEIDSIYQPGSDEPISFWDLSDDVKWNLLSITYFQASIQRYFGASTIVRPDTWPVATDSEDGESAFLRPDGSFCYPLAYRDISAEKASNRARMSFPESIIGLEDYSEMESNRKQIFVDFLRCVQEDGVEVKIVIQPISNVIVEYMKVFERYENFFKAEEMVRGIAAEFDIEITGSFDPEKLEYNMSCFYDGYHLKEQYIEEIVQPFRK